LIDKKRHFIGASSLPLLNFIPAPTWRDLVDILFLTLVAYQLYQWFRETRALRVLIGLVALEACRCCDGRRADGAYFSTRQGGEWVSERISDPELLLERIKEHGLPEDAYNKASEGSLYLLGGFLFFHIRN